MFGHDNEDSKVTGVSDDATTDEPVAHGTLDHANNTSTEETVAAPTAASLPTVSASSDDFSSGAVTPSPLLPTSDRGKADDELLSIKQQALQQLSPLLGHLEQKPEEKFRTTMMMIQASDDKTLIQPAYDAAKQITDKKTRAQALLDIVNEINYFTQGTSLTD